MIWQIFNTIKSQILILNDGSDIFREKIVAMANYYWNGVVLASDCLNFNSLALKPVFLFGRDTLQDWLLWTTQYACLVRFL